MRAHEVNILCGIHTGGSETAIASAIQNARTADPNYYYSFTPIPQRSLTSLSTQRTPDHRVGGIIVKADKEWKDSIYGYIADKSGLGTLARFNID
jgi:hypothetical protein